MCGLGAAAPHAGGLVLAGGAVCGVELPFCPSQEGSRWLCCPMAAPHLLRALPPAVAVPGSGPAAAAARRCPGAVKREM